MVVECTECQSEVEIDASHLGPHAALGLLDPKRVLCRSCIAAAGDVVHIDAGRPWLLHDGDEFREIGSAFVRSDNPAVQRMYHRDEHRDRSDERA